MQYETLHEVLTATKRNAKDQGIGLVIPMITGGVSYGETRRFSFETTNRKRSKSLWQCVVTRMENGRYELVDYFL